MQCLHVFIVHNLPLEITFNKMLTVKSFCESSLFVLIEQQLFTLCEYILCPQGITLDMSILHHDSMLFLPCFDDICEMGVL